MFSGSSAKKTEASELVEVPNFRVFDGMVYSSPLGDGGAISPRVVYGLVSLFTSSFSKESNVKHMVQKTDLFFSNDSTVTPIFYINTRKLQEITEPVLFPVSSAAAAAKRTNTGPLYNAERKWLSHFDVAERAQHAAGVRIQRHILQWDALLRDVSYVPIHTFVRNLFFKELRSAPSQFEDSISKVVFLFAQHNADKFKKGGDEFFLSEDENKCLREYLAQEFSIFLVLASLNTMQLLKEAYTGVGVNIPVSISETTPVQPVLTYPISASGELAEKTFRLFLEIQAHYIAASQLRALPSITSPLVIVDSLISNKPKAHLSAASPSPKVVSVASVSLTRQEAKEEERPSSLQSSRGSSHGSSSEVAYVFGSLSAAQSSAHFKLSEVDRITTKIMDMILTHQQTGEEDVELAHKNGITCDISVKERVPEPGPVSEVDRKKQEDALRDRIRGAVQSTWESGIAEKRTFTFSGYRFKLKTSKPDLEPVAGECIAVGK